DRELASCVAWAALGFEIIDCHYPSWRFTPADPLAGLVVHAALMVGPRREFPSPDESIAWTGLLPGATVTLTGRAGARATGSPAAVLGDPLRALAALSRLIDEQDAERLRSGELVTTGTMTAPID